MEPVTARVESDDVDELQEEFDTDEKSAAIRQAIARALDEQRSNDALVAMWTMLLMLTFEAYGTLTVAQSAGPMLLALLVAIPLLPKLQRLSQRFLA